MTGAANGAVNGAAGSPPRRRAAAPRAKARAAMPKEALKQETTPGRRIPYPFSAIVGQEEMRLALLAAAVDPGIGGVLVFGDRGTGKSTAVRALAALLPPMQAVRGCRYACDPADRTPCEDCRRRRARGALPGHSLPVPVIDLPLGATEDRVVGTLDLERALTAGVKAFEPGLLARAHRGFLYIDEVNLLEDHLVDLLLDVAASGENLVERDGISIRHPARFVLIGSGNPEEGELRPQLLDRFGLSVEIRTPEGLADRVEVVRRRDAFEREPEGFAALWAEEEAATRQRIAVARSRVGRMATPVAVLEAAARLCLALGTDGLRGELTLVRAARAVACLEDAAAVTEAHLRRVAPAALRHRLRRNPLDEAASTTRVERAMAEVWGA
jgi:magnesium chelatase subunit I